MALLFFDIDGTIWDYDNVIPGSTKRAMRLLRENGHKTFICSGRTKVFLQCRDLLALGFDGISGGCGTEIEYHGKELLLKTIDPALIARSIRLFYSHDMPVIMESRDILFMDAEKIGRDDLGKNIVGAMREVTQPIRGNEENWEACKFTVLIKGRDCGEILEALTDDFEVMTHGDYVMEVVPKGYSKATSIAFLCEWLGVDREDTFSFGDGTNDLEMLRFTGTGIAMGNGVDEAKDAADYITDDIHDDGIFNACRHFGLI